MAGIRARKIIIERRGGPERLRLVECAVPVPGPGEVLVANEATGVAFADVLIREGLYPGVSLPATPGYEVVGRVIGLGSGVEGVAVGNRIAALTVLGGYASHVLVTAGDCVPVPDGLSSADAAAVTLNGLTAFQMLNRCIARPAVRKMLVWGAAGGVGSVLLELGRHYGIQTYGIASGKRVDYVREHGGVAIDRNVGNVARAVREASNGGVDVVFDGVGGRNVATSFACLASGGTVVMFGVQGAMTNGRMNPFKLSSLLLRGPRKSAQALMMSNRGLRGYLIEAWKSARPDLYHADLAEMMRLAAAGVIRPAIHAELPLGQAAEAHRMINSGTPIGKIVLRP